MEAIHNLAVTMGKKMDAMMSTLSDIKKKQDHLALELKQVCPPTPVTAGPRQLSVCFPTCSTPAMDPSWYKSDSFTDHTPKAGAKPAFKVSTTTCSEAAFTLPSAALAMPASNSTSTALTEAASVTTPTTKAASKTTPATVKTAKASCKKVDDDIELLTIPIDPGVILNLRYVSASRQNFDTNVMRKLFTEAERETSNVNGGLGKAKLDVDKVEYINQSPSRCIRVTKRRHKSQRGLSVGV